MKKRIIALILVFVFALPLFSAPSYAKYDEEILFRDIPWGLKYNDAVKAANESGIDFEHEILDTFERVKRHNNLYAEVAGEKAEVYLDYYNLEESLDGTPIDDFVFGKAQYTFEFKTAIFADKEIEERAKELLTKLSSLYGKPDEEEESAMQISSLWVEHNYYWYGANNTKLNLRYKIRYDATGDADGNIYIIYTSAALKDEMEALEAKDNEKEAEEEKRKAEEEKRKAEEEERKKQEEQQRKKADVSGL